MSGLTKTKKLERYRVRTDVYYIGDKNAKEYHRKDCAMIDFIKNDDLVPCGAVPENKGLKPCPICKPTPVAIVKSRPKAQTRADILQKALSSVAKQHNMFIRFVGSSAYVSSIAGQWFFNYTADNIVLYHENQDVRYDRDGDLVPGDFHVQDKSFRSPLAAIAYIARHEKAVENRLFISNATQVEERVSDTETGKKLLYIGDRAIRNGEIITALFPEGWCEVKISYLDTGWSISTPEFCKHSPVGLFAAFKYSA